MLKMIQTGCGLVAFVAGLGLFMGLRGSRDGSPGPAAHWPGFLLVLLLALGTWWLVSLQIERRHRLALARAQTCTQLQARARPLVLALVTVLGLALVAIAAACLATRIWLAAAVLVPLALACLAFLWQLYTLVLRPGPMLLLDRRRCHSALYGSIPWSRVRGLYLHRMHVGHGTQSVLMLAVDRPASYLAQAPWLTRALRRQISESTRLGALPIGLNVLDQEPEVILHCALALRSRENSPFLAHWHPALAESTSLALLRLQEQAPAEGVPASAASAQAVEKLLAEAALALDQELARRRARQRRTLRWLQGLGAAAVLGLLAMAGLR